MLRFSKTVFIGAILIALSSCDDGLEFVTTKGKIQFVEQEEPSTPEPVAEEEIVEDETKASEPPKVETIEPAPPDPTPVEEAPTPEPEPDPAGPCPDGQWRSPGTDRSECRNWSVCTSDSIEDRTPTHERDRVCLPNPCRPGRVVHSLGTATSPHVCRVVYRECTNENGVMEPRSFEFAVPGKGCRVYFTDWIRTEPNNVGGIEMFTHLKPAGWNDLPTTGDQSRPVQSGVGKFLCGRGEIPDLSNQSRTFTLQDATDTQRVCPQGSVFAKPETEEENRVVYQQFESEIAAYFTDDPPLPVWINFYREADNTFQVRNPFGP